MEQLKMKLITILLVGAVTINTHAQSLKEIAKAEAAIAANTAAFTTMEQEGYQANLKKQLTKNTVMSTGMLAVRMAREAYHDAKRSTTAFRQESMFYKCIIRHAEGIANNTAKFLNESANLKDFDQAYAVVMAGKVTFEMMDIIYQYSNLVTNGQVKFDAKEMALNIKGDGYNILNQGDRLKLAMDLNYKMSRLHSTTNRMLWTCRTSTTAIKRAIQIAKELDYQTGFLADECLAKKNQIITNWKNTMNKLGQ